MATRTLDVSGIGAHDVITVPLSDLNPDPQYQREVTGKRKATLNGVWDFDLMDPIVVVGTVRNGVTSLPLDILDGGGRYAILRDKLYKETPVRFVRAKSEAEKARKFVSANTASLNLHEAEVFLARAAGGDAKAIRIKAQVESCGFTIGKNASGDVINATGTLEGIDSELLPTVLVGIRDGWAGATDKERKSATAAYIIGGVATYAEYQNITDGDALADAIANANVRFENGLRPMVPETIRGRWEDIAARFGRSGMGIGGATRPAMTALVIGEAIHGGRWVQGAQPTIAKFLSDDD